MAPPPVSGPRRADPPLRRLGPRLSRRGLITSGVLAGVLAATGLALRPPRGTLRLALPRLPEGDWDTARGPDHAAVSQGAVHETLVEVGPGGGLRGELAAAWEAEGAGRVWRLALRPGARFHDGRPVGPGDVAASLARHGDLLGGVEIAAEGEALRLALPEADPNFPFRLAHPRLVAWPGGEPGPVGSGPYRVEAEEPGLLRLARVAGAPEGPGGPGGPGGGAFFERVEAVAAPDPVALVLAGGADAAHLPAPLPARPAGLAVAGEGSALVLHRAGLAHDGLSALGPLDGGRLPKRWWWA